MCVWAIINIHYWALHNIFIIDTMCSCRCPHQYPVLSFIAMVFIDTLSLLWVVVVLDGRFTRTDCITQEHIYRFSHETGTKTHDLPYSESVYGALRIFCRFFR